MASADECPDANSMIEVKICVHKIFLAEDDELNRVYKIIMKQLDDEGKQKLKTVQKAWIVYREAKAEFAADYARGGSHAGYLYCKSRIKSTQQRVQELKSIGPRLVHGFTSKGF
jgi:uncharacterized protein YecT (DUF1311 family)